MDSPQVLLIDDNPNDRLLAIRQLEQEFSELKVIEIGESTNLQQLLNDYSFNLVITDYRLRWTTGLDILHTVKHQYPHCPVIMFTGTGNEEVAVDAMKAGLDDYVIKSPQHYIRLATAVRLAWERYQQTQALQAAESRYRQLYVSVPIGLFRISPSGQILDANPTFLQILGYAEVQTVPLDRLTIPEHVDNHALESWQNQLEKAGTLQGFEAQVRHRQGHLIWVRLDAKAICDRNHTTLFYEGALEDITERKQAEQERVELLAREQQARMEAETASRIKDEFLATLSHELRTPLNAILGWLQLLQQGELSPEQTSQALTVIERNAQAQNQLIQDLLDVSRIIRGKMKLVMAPCTLPKIIDAAVATVRPSIEAKNIQLSTQIEPSTARINGDVDRLQQVLWNLLSNAVRFTPTGGQITISLTYPDNTACIQITDNGEGIAEDQLPRLFERFRQVDSSSTRTHGGLGLGLAIVRNLVELHGGTVSATSPGLGQGSTFTIQIPCLSGEPAFKVAHSDADPTRQSSHSSLAGLQILVVEDEIDSRVMIQLLLEQKGAQVTTVDSVPAAWAAIERYPPDLLISDIAMPGEDGYSLIRQIRDSEQIGKVDLPAIALTAYASEQDKQKALAVGFSAHLSKPVEPGELLVTIANLRSK